MTLGPTAAAALISLSFHASTPGVVGLDRLDSFGRVADLRFENGAGATLFRGEYTHDVAGSRLAGRITQAQAPGTGGDNERSQVNGYDPLNRLIETEVGELDWTYDAYGQVLTADHIHPFPPPHCGHKGLFVDRLDVPVIAVEGEAAVENPRLWPLAAARYYARNRTYAPELGRWVQMDPYSSGSLILGSTPLHGASIEPELAGFGLPALLGDGANLAGYVGSNPWTHGDPLGLWTLPELTVTSLLKRGFAMYETYEKADVVKDFGMALVSGIGIQQALLSLAADLILSTTPGPGGRKAAEDVLELVGKTSNQIARRRIAGFNWHHVFAKFLGGNADGIRHLLTKEQHIDFHKDLYSRLGSAGYKLSGKKGDDWTKLLQRDEDKVRVLEILQDASMEFDRHNGTRLLPALLEQISKQVDR